MTNVGKFFWIPVTSLGGVHLISGIADFFFFPFVCHSKLILDSRKYCTMLWQTLVNKRQAIKK